MRHLVKILIFWGDIPVTIVIAVLVFGLLIFIHELGHFIAARIFHVRIYEFAIGMGPKLLWYESKKTGIVYALRMIPFGGFVSMEGELSPDEASKENVRSPEAQAPAEDALSEAPQNTEKDPRLGALAEKPAWQRLIVHAAGAVQHLLFGFLICVILTATMNVGGTTVGQFAPVEGAGPSSEEQGLRLEDEVLKVGSRRVHISEELYYEIVHQGGGEEPLTLTVRRGEEILTLEIVFPTQEESGTSFGVIDFLPYAEEKSFGVVVKQAFYKSKYLVTMVWDSLIDLVSGRYSLKAVSGPVGTATVISDAAKSGFSNLLLLTALVSVNLGIFNLLPLPALDGGHILYTLIELVSRRRLPAKAIQIIDSVGMILLLGLMVVVTAKDIFTLIF